MTDFLHLVDRFPYVTTLCGLPLASVGDDWTDAIVEVLDENPDGCCPRCLARGRKIVRRDDGMARAELATEAGMLHGIDAYNDVMGFDVEGR